MFDAVQVHGRVGAEGQLGAAPWAAELERQLSAAPWVAVPGRADASACFAAAAVCLAAAAGCIAVAVGWASVAGARPAAPKVAFVDVEDPYTTNATLKPCLEQLGIPAKAVGASGRFAADKQPVLLIGSFVTGHKKVGKSLKRNGKQLARFVQDGGLLVVFGQADQNEAILDWLPAPLSAARGERDAMQAELVAADHPLLSTPNRIDVNAIMDGEVLRSPQRYAPSVLGATDLFVKAQGFRVLLAEKKDGSFPIAMIGASGKGAVVLMAVSPDRLCVKGKDEASRNASAQLVENLVSYGLQSRDAALESPDPPFTSGASTHAALVFVDSNGNGKQDAEEAAMPGVTITYDLTDFVTDENGEARIPVDDAAPHDISIRIPDGMFATTPWFVPANFSGPHHFGIKALGAGARGASKMVHISDVHIGRTESPPADDEAFRKLLRQVGDVTGPGDLFAITGDNTHTGGVSDTRMLARSLGLLENPTAVVMGNHDEGNGPDWGRLHEWYIAPAYNTLEWNGFLVVSLPRLEMPKRARKWFQDTLAGTNLKVILLVHDLPERASLNRLDRNKVVAVLSGHWHGDQVSTRNGITQINGPTATIGAWDFSPGSARILTFADRGIAHAETIPYVKRPIAVPVVVGSREVLCNRLGLNRTPEMSACGQGSGSCPNAAADGIPGAGESLEQVGFFSWRGTLSGGSTSLQCGDDEDAAFAVDCQSAPGACTVSGADGFVASHASWATAIPGHVLLASPRLHGNSVLVPFREGGRTGWGGGVCALAVQGGATDWCTETETMVSGDLAVSGGNVIVSEVDGTISSLRIRDGAVSWRSELEDVVPPRFAEHYLYSSPVVEGGHAYYCYQGGAFSVSLSSGRIDWHGKPIGGADAFAHSAGVVSGKSLYCGAFMGGLYRYSLSDAAPAAPKRIEKWDVTADLRLANSVIVLSRGKLGLLDPDSGAITQTTHAEYCVLPASPALGSGFLVLPDGNAGVRRFTLASKKTSWRVALHDGPLAFALNRRESAGIIGSPALDRNTVYVPGTDGRLLELDAGRGTVQREWDFGIPLVSTPAVAKTAVFVADYGGMVYAVER